MTGRPLNIADFRCRIMKARAAHFSLREASRPTTLKVVDSPAWREESEGPVVYDIGVAREAQRQRRRAFRPVLMQRRAQVIRFGDNHARAIAAGRGHASWPLSTDGGYDLPPAA